MPSHITALTSLCDSTVVLFSANAVHAKQDIMMIITYRGRDTLSMGYRVAQALFFSREIRDFFKLDLTKAYKSFPLRKSSARERWIRTSSIDSFSRNLRIGPASNSQPKPRSSKNTISFLLSMADAPNEVSNVNVFMCPMHTSV